MAGFPEALERQKGILRVMSHQRRRRASQAVAKKANAEYTRYGQEVDQDHTTVDDLNSNYASS